MYKKINYFSFFIELIPLAFFFIIYSLSNLYLAASISVFISLITLCFFKYYENRVSIFAIFSLFIGIVFTLLSLLLQNPVLIKIQPTIFNGCFAILLLGGVFKDISIMKYFFSYQFNLNSKTWFILSKRWGLFFLILSISNEIIWRYFSEEQWVYYKTFIASSAVMIFILLQVPITLKGRIN